MNIPNKESWIQDCMTKFNDKIVKDFMEQYNLSEQNARKGLAEYYYYNYYECEDNQIPYNKI